MIRARTLSSVRNGSVTLREGYRLRAYGFFPEVFLEQLARSLHGCYGSPQLIWPCSLGRRYSPSRPADPLQSVVPLPRSRLTLVLFEHRQGEQPSTISSSLSWSYSMRTRPGVRRKGSHFVTRTTTAPTPNKARTYTGQSSDIHRIPRARRQRPGTPHLSATLCESTRLRAARPRTPRREPIRSRCP